MSFGPNPWQQTSWDWRAAGNFIGGGAGTGLLITSVIFAAANTGIVPAFNGPLLLALALIGLGLFCVWLEIGRPLRALHVFFNLRTSWMSREALAALFLFPAGLAALWGVDNMLWASATLAVLFLYCQSRMLPAARGIPAWRPMLLTPLIFVTGLCEGAGIFLLRGLWSATVLDAAMSLLVLLVAVRLLLWLRYRRKVEPSLAPRARAALNRAGRLVLILGTVAPLLLLGVSAWLMSGDARAVLAALAGAGAAFAGAYLKYTLVTRASFNQGFALTKLPVRGVRTGQ